MSDELTRDSDELIRQVRAQTPARILVERAGPAYSTATWLTLRQDHAAALDAVNAEIELTRDFGAEFVERWQLFEVQTQAASKHEYLLRPDLGRRLDPLAYGTIAQRCAAETDVQIVVGDGLSATAVIAQVPALLPAVSDALVANGLSVGRPFFVRHARVGVINDIGEILRCGVVVLLIGERPGLATVESLSAYLAHRPNSSHTDANRNLISNIHVRGVPIAHAATRIAALCQRMLETQSSGFGLKEEIRTLHQIP
jgi:ethanolamine ammonia-lyase small subunit